MKHDNTRVRIIVEAKQDYSQNLSTCICENGKYLKIITYTSVITYDEIIYVVDWYQQM